MTNDINSKTDATQPRRVSRVAVLAQAAAIPLLIAVGWFVRGLLPSGPVGPMPGMMGGPAGPPAVIVAPVTEGAAEAPKEFVGYVEPIETVNVMPQVAGYLEAVHFEEGALVTAGELLFTIEKAPFEARVALSEAAVQRAEANVPAAQADLQSAKANLVRAEKYFERLKSADERSVVQAEMDKASADFEQAQALVKQTTAAVEQAKAALEEAKANLSLARIDLGYTEIRAPITGRLGEALMTAGNYVTPASGPLARIVQVDPIRVVYSMSDREYTEMVKLIKENPAAVTLGLRLPDGTLYEDSGTWSFADNEMDPATGTIAIRARFDNSEGLLVPKTNLMVLAQPAEARTAPQVPSEAVMVDQAGEFVYVVNAEGVTEERRVVLGAEMDGHRIVEDGLSVGERVIVQGLLKVQPGQPVEATTAPAASKGN